MNYSTDIKKKLKILSQDYPNVKFIQSKVRNKEEWINKIGLILRDDIALNLWNNCNLKEGNIIFLAYGPEFDTVRQNFISKYYVL